MPQYSIYPNTNNRAALVFWHTKVSIATTTRNVKVSENLTLDKIDSELNK